MINKNQLAIKGISLLQSQLRRLSHLQSRHFFSQFSLSSPASSSPAIPSSNPSLKTPFCPFSHTPSLCRNSNEEDPNRSSEGTPKLVVVQPRVRPNANLQAKLNEALNLANSLDEQRDGYFSTDLSLKQLPPHVVVQNPLSSSGKGRSGEVDAVFVNAILSAIQQRNLERAWEKPVLDRVGLIIEIFNAHAYTKEAKLQAELAAIMYKKSRLVRVRASDGRYTFGTKGEAEVVSARGRGSGGRGFISGAGETELELQRRRISERRKRLLAEIEEVRKTRAVQRAGRRKQGVLDAPGLATVAVVGYTNAGKSTLVSALSDSDLYSDDRLFATVDPRVRGVALPSGRKVLLSDTVGFISDLPVQLIEAFHATLEEVAEADLLVHVLDSSALNLEEQREAVLDVLRQIGVSGKKIESMIEVWNKIDLERDTDTDTDTGIGNFNNDNDYRFVEDEDEIADKQLQEDKENQQNDDSSDWLGSRNVNEDEEDQLCSSKILTGVVDQKTEPLNESSIKEDGPDTHSESKHIPHVKTSAVTGVGLQELLELIDDKLVQIDKEQRSSQRVLEKSEFDRKWRPIQAEKVGIAVE
uniref:Hflx-type G domain-containing protein n=1 Tax=Chenopodium quinoa TaxID=63459 RepID=A0A803L6R1_CHEQI